jgi:hypothetical protein
MQNASSMFFHIRFFLTAVDAETQMRKVFAVNEALQKA